jgi:co-chaperonin GroES (HSP10)
MTKSAFAPYQISRENFQPIRDWVVCTDMNFEGRTLSSGVILLNDNGRSDGIRPRWGQVYAIGPDQHDVRVGDWICVAHGRWTRGVDIEDQDGKKTVRRIDPKDIMLVSDQLPADDTVSNAVLA